MLMVPFDWSALLSRSSWAIILSVPGMSVMLQPSGARTVSAGSVDELVVDAINCCAERSVTVEEVIELAVPQAAKATGSATINAATHTSSLLCGTRSILGPLLPGYY